jgi:GGDEF domain-containing protein
MSPQELTIWSMSLGMIAAVALARLASFAWRRRAPQLQAVGYHGAVFLLVWILSGVAAHVDPQLDDGLLHIAQVLAGPFCVGLSDLWIGGWLYAPHRDRLMAGSLHLSALLLPGAGAACLLLPVPLQLPAAAAVSLLGGTVTLWLTARAARQGDALAPLMAAGCVFTLPAIAGLYAIAMQWPGVGLRLHAVFASCAALANAITGLGLWRRELQEERARRRPAMTSQIDPVTSLRSGRSLVHRLLRSQRRRNRSGRDGAVLAVLVFDIERLRTQTGTAGLHEIYIGLASRLQRQVGAVNIVGRYYEGCFVALIDSIPSVDWLRALAQRLTANLRKPLPVTLRSGERAQVAVDLAVGIVHLSRPAAAVEDVLDDAQRMAVAARAMRSRAAVRDPRNGQPTPIEDAHLGPSRRRAPALVRAAH